MEIEGDKLWGTGWNQTMEKDKDQNMKYGCVFHKQQDRIDYLLTQAAIDNT